MKLISFSLYGDNPKYINGMWENIELQPEIYPDWQIIIYHDDTVPQEYLSKFKQNGAMLKNMSDSGLFAADWRFLSYDEECERFIVRDSDSRISYREAAIVKEWEEDDTVLHIIRDHPHHGYAIMGGMWGMKTKCIPENYSMMQLLSQFNGNNNSNPTNRQNWIMKDQHFLKHVIYPLFANPENSTIHATQDYMHRVPWNNEHWAKDTPPRNDENNFIGEIFDYINGMRYREYQYKEL